VLHTKKTIAGGEPRNEPTVTATRQCAAILGGNAPAAMSAQGDGIGAKLTGESGEEFTWLQGLRGISSSLDDAWSGHRPTPFPDTDPILAMREDSVFRHGKDLACRKAKELGYPHEMWTDAPSRQPCA
jgi:hypothetical protein